MRAQAVSVQKFGRAPRRASVRLALLVTGALLGATSASASAAASISSTPDKTVVTDGTVYAVAHSGNLTYIGGSFSRVGPRTGSWAALSAASGQFDPAMPQVSGDDNTVAHTGLVGGRIDVTVPDGSGGFYIGGSFTHVGGLARNNVAHIRADKSVDPVWNPNANSTVGAMVVSGSTVYLGGEFGSINGNVQRHLAAAVDATTGVATGWNPNPNSTVLTMAAFGGTIYLGGAFNTINGTKGRDGAAAVDATTGVASGWDPSPNSNVDAIAVSSSGSTVYLGGQFTQLNQVNNGLTRNRAAAVDAVSGAATNWDPNLNGTVQSLVLSGSTVYLGGSFIDVNNGTTRNRAAAVDASTGTARAWNPNLNGPVLSVSVLGSTVYLGGFFNGANSINGNQTRNFLAAVDATLGSATSWDPNPNGGVASVAATGSTIAAGGYFASLGGEMRNDVAALNASDGSLAPWNPNISNGIVDALAVSGSTVYLGGSFTGANSINGTQTRNFAAAVDATTGTATAWDPKPAANVATIAVSGSTVYLGGDFHGANSINGNRTRNFAAAVDATSGTATGWDPNLNAPVFALASSGSTVYLGGSFSSINAGKTRHSLAAVDATSGIATGWDPNANNRVQALALSGSTVYLGGDFTSINGNVTRNHAAAVDAASGNATSWDPNVNDTVLSLAVSGSTVYLGGLFAQVNGATTRNFVAAVDPTSGIATDWDPNAGDPVMAIVADGHGGVLVGGEFNTLGLAAQRGFAAFSGQSVNLSVSLAGTGAGIVSGSGISCPGQCTNSYAVGTPVSLLATPKAGSKFAGWSGACSNATGPCPLTLNSDLSVTAHFTKVTLATPSVSGVRLSPTVFAAASSGPSAQQSRAHKPARKFGAKVSYKLNIAAPVRFTVQQDLPGRLTGKGKAKHCVAPSGNDRHAHKCTRVVTLHGSFSRAGKAGTNSFHFTGRLDGHKLSPGKYLLVATPSAGGKTGRQVRIGFQIVP